MTALVLRGVSLTATFVLIGPALSASAGHPAAAGEAKLLWQIGAPDRSAAEFALGPDGWREFPTRFADGPVFIVGRSDPREEWPYAHPGPADGWAGSRPHTFTVFFGLAAAPTRDGSRLLIELIDTHNQVPPRWRLDVNGHVLEYQMPVGRSDDSLYGRPSAGRAHRCEFPIPAAALRAGNNALTIRSLSGSWVVYDWLGLEVPADVQGAAVQPATLILSGHNPPVRLRAQDGRARQLLQLSIQHTGEPGEAALSIDGGPGTPLALKRGNQQVEVAAPAVERTTPVKVTLQLAGKTVAERPLDVKPVRPWVVYLLPHSHVDIGYTHVQTEVEKKQWEYLDLAIATARKTAEYPAGARFRWNVEVMWAVDSYLRQASPEQRQAFVDAVKAGWLELDALYGNELTALCRPEELIRLVECAGQVARRCGVPLESALISDVPGYTWGIVPVLAQAGVKYFSVGPNPGDRIGGTLSAWGDKPFYWEGPSGQERILCWVAGKGYAFFHGANIGRMGAGPLLSYLEQLDQAGYPYELVQVRYSIGGDNGPPDPGMCEFVRKWNETHEHPRLVIATAREMFHDFEQRYGDGIPKVSGDFTPYWEDGAASSARETALNRASAERLIQAEMLFALLARTQYPAEAFSAAWRHVILYDEHTWGAYNSISEPDAPFVKDQWRIKQAFALDGDEQSRALLAAALAPRGAAAGEVAAVDVFNTSSWPRTDLVTWPQELRPAGDVVHGPDGAVVPSQRLAGGALVFLASDLPPLAARRYTLGAGAAPAQGQARADGATLSTPRISVRIDEQSGAIVSLRGTAVRAELVDAHAAVALNDYRYVLGSDVAGARRNGPVRISVQEAGPLVAALRVESEAPGCHKLIREVRVVDGLERVDILNTVDKQAVREKEGVHFGFGFHVPEGVMRMDVPWAVVRPEADQLPGACKNWFTVQRWVDVSNARYGVTWATLDAPLVEVGALTADRIGSQNDVRAWIQRLAPSATLYSWVMNNHWHTNYKADQEGPTTFRYSIRPHGAFDPGAAQRFGLECSQPLIACPGVAAAPPTGPLLRVEPADVIVTSLKPVADGQALVARLFNASDRQVRASVTSGDPAVRTLYRSGPGEERGASLSEPIEMPAWAIVTLRCEPS